MGILDELDSSVEKTLDILPLRVFQKESQIVYVLILMPVETVVSCTVNNFSDIVFL